MGAPILKDVTLPTVKEEAGQVLKDITSGVGLRNALKRGAKCTRKTILKGGTQRIMQGKERKQKRDSSTALSMLLKSPKQRRV